MNISIGGKADEVIEEPQRHLLLPTRKELHGWWLGKRECTSERMLINPYNGCEIGCFFCYSLAFPGHFQTFRKENIIIVAKDFDKIVSDQLDSIDVACCGYLSPVTDPFQSVNNLYRLSEKIIKMWNQRLGYEKRRFKKRLAAQRLSALVKRTQSGIEDCLRR